MIIEWVEKCKSCAGTGIYKGLAERGMIGVVCHSCNGKGKRYQKHEYEEFVERKVHPDVVRVIETNPGICAGATSPTDDKFGGMTYNEWSAGKSFVPGMEMRLYTCPAGWYQGVDYNLKPDWDECIWGVAFSSCGHFRHKADCWKKWDEEHKRSVGLVEGDQG